MGKSNFKSLSEHAYTFLLGGYENHRRIEAGWIVVKGSL
jgi:hypothetical protein